MSTLTLQPADSAGFNITMLSLEASKDTNTDGGQAFTVGKDSVGNEVRGLIKFDISGLPAGVTISAAILTLIYYNENGSANTMDTFRVLRAMTQTGATWNSYSAGNSWATAGCGNSTTDYQSTAIQWTAAATGYPSDTSVDINITTFVQSWYAGTYTNNGMVIKANDPSGISNGCGPRIRSSYWTTSGQRPKLVITYTAAAGPTNMKTFDGVATASVKTINGVAIASVKTFNGVA